MTVEKEEASIYQGDFRQGCGMTVLKELIRIFSNLYPFPYTFRFMERRSSLVIMVLIMVAVIIGSVAIHVNFNDREPTLRAGLSRSNMVTPLSLM